MLTIKDVIWDDRITDEKTVIEIKWRRTGEVETKTCKCKRLDYDVFAFANCSVFWMKWDETANVLTLATRGQPDDWYKENR